MATPTVGTPHEAPSLLTGGFCRSHTWATSGGAQNRKQNQKRSVRFTTSVSTLTGSSLTSFTESSTGSPEARMSRRKTFVAAATSGVQGPWHDDLEGEGEGHHADLGGHPGLGRRTYTRTLLSYYRSKGTDYGYHSNHVRSHTAPEPHRISEDGRMPVLPPLGVSGDYPEGAAAAGRLRRQTTNGYGPSLLIDDMGLARADVKQRRVSVAVDRKVVTHLRRQLNRRLERRVNLLLEEELEGEMGGHFQDEEDDRQIGDIDVTLTSSQTSFKAKHQESNDPDLGNQKEADSKQPSHDALPSITRPEKTEVTSAVKGALETISTIDPLPEIRNEDLVVAGNDVTDSAEDGDQDDEHGVEEEIEKVLSQDLTSSQDVSSQQEVTSQPEVVVSPVPTPYMYRPETRDQQRLSLQEKVKRILGGSMVTSFVLDKRMVTIFISGHCTDSDGERSVILERVLPGLRGLVAEHGYTLHVVDPHWGVRDLITDSHNQQDLIMGLIETSGQNTRGINFVSFLGQKYGEPLLPVTVPQSEFEVIRTTMEQDYLKEVQAAAAAAAAAEEKKKRDEELRKLNPEAHKKERRLPNFDEDEEEELEEEDADDELKDFRDDNEDDFEKWRGNSNLTPGTTRDRSVSFDSALIPCEDDSNTNSAKRRMSVTLRESRPTRKRMEKLWNTSKNAGKELMTSKVFRRDASTSRSGQADIVDPGLLKSWYLLDTNVVPPVYRLQNISSHYKDFTRNDANKRQAARQQWLQTAAKLQRMLSAYADKLLDTHAARKYSTSLLEVEVQQGLLWSPQDPVSHAFWFRRDIEDLPHHLNDPLSRDYADIQPISGQPDHQLMHALYDLRESKMEEALPKEGVWKYPVNWSSNGVSLSSSRSHAIYLDRMCKEFHNIINARMREAFSHDVDRTDMTSDVFKEVVQHVNFCQHRARTFHGRKHLLQMLKTYIRSTHRRPLVVYGGTGSGKTALLAKAARDTAKWLRGISPVVVFRAVGLTPASSNLRLMLRDICRQLMEAYGDGADTPSNDHKGLVNDFNFRLTLASESHPLVVFVDGVNLLSDENDARKMTWLPKELPPNVKLIISTLREADCYTTLQQSFQQTPEAFLEVPDLPVPDAVTILEHWFHADGRAVTQEQFDVLVDTFTQCPAPLYLKLAYQEAVHWPSYLPAGEIKLVNTVKKMAVNIFGRLEKDHGEPLVRRALGYITASRNGVTESEIEDLLSLDDAVLDDIFLHTKPSLRRLPQVYWLRLRRDLDNYLVETITDNTITLRWFHHQFMEAATERYLNQRDKAPSYHKAMSEYFLDIWSDKPKPSPKAGAMLRHVAPHPLFFESSPKDGTPLRRTYNLRRLMELPFQLLRSQQVDMLKKECLCNFDFLLAKISAISLRSVFDDFQMTFLMEPADGSMRMLSDTLSLSANVLDVDPQQLASQLVGRLHRIVTSDIPVAPADPVKYPYLKPLFKSIMKSTTPALLPSSTCLTPPGGILFDLLYGHTEPITAVVSTADGQRAVTASRDNTLKLWELRSGRVTRTVQGVGANVFSIRLGAGNAIVVTSEVDRIRIWNLQSGKMMRDITEYDDPANVTIATETNLLAAFFDGCKKLRVFNLGKEGVPLTKEVDLSGENNIHKDKSFLVSQNTNGVQVLYAFRSGSQAFVRNIKSGKRIHKFEFTGSATAVATSREYFIVAVRKQYMKLHEISQLELYDMSNGQFIRTVRGCISDNIRELHINQLGSHALVVSSSEANNTSDIAVWNIETEDHKHLAKHSNVSNFGACVDVRYCLTASPNENSLRIWNLTGKINVPAPKAKAQEGLEKLIPIPAHPKYIIAKSLLNGPLTVWNIAKKKFTGMVVRSMTGIMDINDIMVVKDTKLMILTEKGFSNVSATIRPVFQTILVYDLIEAKFTNRITGCYIVPCQPHEYIILNDEHFLGLSDTRSHFVVWSLKTGHVSYRIKANFKNDGDENEDDDYGSRRKKEVTIQRRRNTTAKMAPWDRRAETQTARQRRHVAEVEEEKERIDGIKKEKDNAIEQFLISKDLSTIVASYYGHHLCVFDVPSQSHKVTLENENSMLLLHVAALTDNGSHLVLANYDDETKTSYVTLWNCRDGTVKKRLRNEKNVCCIAMNAGAQRIVFGKTNKELRIWDPLRSGSMNRIHGYASLNFGVGSQIHMLAGGQRAVVYAGDISVWDLDCGALLAVFTPDMTIQGFTVAMDGQMLVFGLRDRSDVITLRLLGNAGDDIITPSGENLFGEVDSSSDEDEGEDEKENSDDDDY